VGNGQFLQTQVLARFIARSAFANGIYPINRFTRFEYGATLQNVDRSLMYISQGIDFNVGLSTGFYLDSIVGAGSLNYVSPFVAWVQDNALFGPAGAIYGHRYRLSAEQQMGNVQWTNFGVDLRRYDPLVFSLLTVATRFSANLSVGRDELEFPKFIGRPDFIRGYDRELYAGDCSSSVSDPNLCGATQLLGSRVAFANVELRFPLVRRFVLGLLPVSLPPVDGLFFYDMGMAWSKDQSVSLRRPENYDFVTQRYPLSSYGFGIRMNLFNIALIRWDYTIPRDGTFRNGYWFWTLGQSF
jgi:outer membrane protein assembly factor BamA